MVPNPVPNNLTCIEVLFSILTFSILNSMLPFSMSPFFRCCRSDVPVFFDVLVFDIPVFPNIFKHYTYGGTFGVKNQVHFVKTSALKTSLNCTRR
jgi:hypothetical protein